MTPHDVLKRVGEIIEDRRASYGDPDAMFEEIAHRWGLSERGVAVSMADLKMARLAHKWNEDSAIDAIAYLVFAIMFADADD